MRWPLEQDSKDPSSSQVAWQVAWFALLALGLATMTQPCGNVLCMKATNHRFYMRAAPIVCVFDVVQFIVFLILGFSCSPQVWLRNIKFELKKRFDQDSSARDRKSAENSTIMRWLLMILGGSQFQVIKLMAMKGIPWTQVWATMFFISIVFGELLILSLRALNLDDDSSHIMPAWRRSARISDALDHIGIIPVSLQIAISCETFIAFFMWLVNRIACWSIDPCKADGPSSVVPVASICIFPLLFLSPMLPGFLTAFHVNDSASIPPFLRPEIHYWTKHQLCSLLCFTIISVSLFTPYVLKRHFYELEDSISTWIWRWITMRIFFSFVLWGLANNLPKFIPRRIQRRIFRVDSFQGSQAVVLAFLTFLASILHYGVLYESFGTVNPKFTGIFGR